MEKREGYEEENERDGGLAVRPMLAATIDDINAVRWPLLGSIKIDGIRILTTSNGSRTRSWKQVPNIHARFLLNQLPAGLDGEIGVGEPVDFRQTTSGIMSIKGKPTFTYFVFDNYIASGAFVSRCDTLKFMKLPDWVVIVPQVLINSLAECMRFFEKSLLEGNEGIILRKADAGYKFNRSTFKEHGMLKMKPWEDAEALCIGIVEEMHNANPVIRDVLGYATRSSASIGKIGKGTVGALIVKSDEYESKFEIGSGFTAEERKVMWNVSPVGKIVKFKYLKFGNYTVPRHAVFAGFRAKEDME